MFLDVLEKFFALLRLYDFDPADQHRDRRAVGRAKRPRVVVRVDPSNQAACNQEAAIAPVAGEPFRRWFREGVGRRVPTTEITWRRFEQLRIAAYIEQKRQPTP